MGSSKYETYVKPYFDDIFFWYSHGKTLDTIAAELGIARSTFLKYKQDYSDLSDLLKKADKSRPHNIAIKAEKALKDKLTDREFEEVHTEQWLGDKNQIIKKHVKKVKKTIPADTTAVIFALKNNDNDRYGERNLLDKRIELLEKQIEKLKAEAEIAQAKVKTMASEGDEIKVNIVYPQGNGEEHGND